MTDAGLTVLPSNNEGTLNSVCLCIWHFRR